MKLFIYKFLHNYPFFLYIKDFIIYLFFRVDNIKIFQDVIIITSIIPFNKMKQRQQQLALSLSKIHINKTIIYYEIDFGRINSSYELIDDNLIITNSLLLIKNKIKDKNIKLLAGGNLNIKDLFKFLNLEYSEIIFDYYDNLDGYDNYLYKTLLTSLYKYNKIICSAKLLEEQIKKMGYNNTLYIPNGVSSQDWLNLNDIKLIDIKNKYFNDGNKIIGFYGAIEHWIDYELIKYIVDNNNDKIFVFIGPDNGNYLKNNGLLNFKNFKYLGYKSFEDLKYYSFFFNVAIIPFKINKITDAVSPVKFFEYLNQGKPVVTTGFKEILFHKDYCFIGENYEDFNKKIQLAIEKFNNLEYKSKIINYSKKFEWNNLAKDIF